MTDRELAAAVYNGTFIFIAICYNLLWRTAAVNNRLLHARASRLAVQRIFDSYRYGPLWYGIAFMLAFVSVTASLVVNLVIAIFFARPGATANE